MDGKKEEGKLESASRCRGESKHFKGLNAF